MADAGSRSLPRVGRNTVATRTRREEPLCVGNRCHRPGLKSSPLVAALLPRAGVNPVKPQISWTRSFLEARWPLGLLLLFWRLCGTWNILGLQERRLGRAGLTGNGAIEGLGKCCHLLRCSFELFAQSQGLSRRAGSGCRGAYVVSRRESASAGSVDQWQVSGAAALSHAGDRGVAGGRFCRSSGKLPGL